MTKEDLVRNADKQSYEYNTKYSEDYTLKDMLKRPQDFVEGTIENIVDLLKKKAYRDGLIDSAEPRELKIAELERENTGLREKLKPENCLKLLAKEGYVKFTSDQLDKATKIIKDLLDTQYRLDPYRDIFKDRIAAAEQFISEVEK